MRRPDPHLDYHLVRFHDSTESAAYLAAVSRFLGSSRGQLDRWRAQDVEIWRHIALSGAPVDVYLNDAALAAATAAFGAMPVVGRLYGKQLPSNVELVVSNYPGGWGLEQMAGGAV